MGLSHNNRGTARMADRPDRSDFPACKQNRDPAP